MKDLTVERKIAVAVIMTLIVFTVAFIWSNSCQSAERSSGNSEAVYSTVQRLVDGVFGADRIYLSHSVIRKLAHFAEFALLGTEFITLITLLDKQRLIDCAKILPYGVLVAAVDECLQFTSDRAPSIIDVLIDFSGYFFAAAFFFFVFYLFRKIKSKKTEKAETV